MKKLLVTCLSLSLGILLMPYSSYARQITISSYYPSPTGNYTKVQLINGANGPNENYASSGGCYCAISSLYPNGVKTGDTFCDAGDSAVTYTNAGTIFADPNSEYLEICKTDGSVASYPGASFNRFCTGAGCATAQGCPTGYTIMPNSTVNVFSAVNSTAYSCAFTNSGSTFAKAGCFSNFSNSPIPPVSCSSIDSNAYDMGCQTIVISGGNTVYKRDCCFNSGPNALGSSSSPSICS